MRVFFGENMTMLLCGAAVGRECVSVWRCGRVVLLLRVVWAATEREEVESKGRSKARVETEGRWGTHEGRGVLGLARVVCACGSWLGCGA